MENKIMINMFKKLSYKHQIWEVYSDFIELATLSISNACDRSSKWDIREERYKNIINKYDDKEKILFPKLLGELIIQLNEQPSDIMGQIFMELELGNKYKGQFFTPYNICELMAEIIIDDNIRNQIKKKGFVTLNEPCSGGGAMIIAFAEAMKKRKLNPQKYLKVICQDLDFKSVCMTYLQLSFLGIPAIVMHMNTLSLEIFDKFYTPVWIYDGWDFKKEK
ncbi:N-6 DNA methylase [Clostridium butyricum]|uniref:N-6 DNA methylase n=1 Tax=Clostridium butyricum TaxID=1492 RepID=UPI000903C324|nr:N-6 DNA methylase [Clostridium butyricum]APF21564.1 N-6 DNA Methylase family protein [Clostridium butyricum]